MRNFLKTLEQNNEITHIFEEVDPTLEIAEIHRRVLQESGLKGGKALYFHNVKNSPFPVVTNLFGSEKRIELAFPTKPDQFIKSLLELTTGPLPPKAKMLWQKRSHLARLFTLGLKRTKNAPVAETICSPPNLDTLPLLKLWPDDGGHFITLPLVYTESPNGKSQNLGMYRIQRYDQSTTGLHFQIGKGGGFHYFEAEAANQKLPVSIFVGGPPALMISAIAPLPENVPELIFASLLQAKKLSVTRMPDHPHPIIADCEFALLGHANPRERRLEGPFGDHFGYYSLAHDFPVFHCTKLLHRKGAIWPATVVGKPIQEDLFIGNFLQKLFSPLFPIVMPQVKELHTFAETGFHPLAAAIVRERYEKECLSSAFRILGEGQLSLTKCLMLTDQPIDITNIKLLLETVLSRLCPEGGVLIFSHTSNDTLDYTGPKLNRGSKLVLVGVGKEKRTLPRECRADSLNAIVFCPGCLVVDCVKEIKQLAENPAIQNFPLVIVVDDAKKTTASNLDFLWTVFTRFEPASDIHPRSSKISRNQAAFEFPLVIDARMKAHYPKEVEADPATIKLVDEKWSRYFNS